MKRFGVRRPSGIRHARVFSALLLLAAAGAQAQVQRSFINQSFEQPATCAPVTQVPSTAMPGWNTTHSVRSGLTYCGAPAASYRPIETWQSGAQSVATAPGNGNQLVELNAFEASRLYQTICLVPGERVTWRLDHRGRAGTDVMSFNIGADPAGSSAGAVEIARVSSNTAGGGSIVAGSCGLGGTCNALASPGAGWSRYEGEFVWTGAAGEQTVGFEAISAAGGIAAGNLLDGINLVLRPYAEFFPGSVTAGEADGNASVPAIRVSGVIGTTFDVVVTITGGTAVLGADFTAPGSSFTVTIPAGDYGTGADFPLPLSVVDDTDIEGDETVTLAIAPDPDNYAIGSTSVCGAAANAGMTWTLADNDVDLSVSKDDGAATYVPGFDVSYTIVVANDGPAAVVGALVDDPLPAGIATASWTCGNATNGGVCGVASGTGAIDTTVDLPAGASVTYTMNLLVPPDFTGSLVNTATVAAPAGFVDADASDNTASDTDTMEPPPTSGACSPLLVVQGTDFTLAPFPTTGTVQKSAASGWQADNPWATQGGDYTFTWTFSQPIPASWIRFSVIDVNEPGNDDYQADPPVFSIAFGPGSTATAADFSLAAGDLAWSGGALRYQPGGPYRQSGHLQGSGGNTVTSITISSSAVGATDFIANALYVRPACVTLQKTSEDGTGSFGIDTTNVVEADGSAVPAVTLATTAPDTPVSSAGYYSIIDQDVTLSEVVPTGWNLDAAICTDQNAGDTGNPPVIGSFSTPMITIPAGNVRPEADIQCLFTNQLLPAADLAVTKTAAADDARTGDQMAYTLVVTNNGPESADGALLTDPQPAGLDCGAGTLTCSAEAGGAVCPASPTVADLQGAGVAIPTFPAGGSVEFTLTCTVTATGAP